MQKSLRIPSKSTWIATAIALVALKILVTILWEYRWYFPPDFSRSFFLSGHKQTFTPIYAAAFYVHIVCGPLAVLVGSYLMVSMTNRADTQFNSGNLPSAVSAHRVAGKVLAVLVIGGVFPSGMVMARQALAGPVAAWGFGFLAVSTGVCMATAIFHAVRGDIRRHQQWATRCYLLLVSPLLLRMVSGVMIVTQLESNPTYQINAWVSWLIPLIAYELWRWVVVMQSPRPMSDRRVQRPNIRFEEVKI